VPESDTYAAKYAWHHPVSVVRPRPCCLPLCVLATPRYVLGNAYVSLFFNFSGQMAEGLPMLPPPPPPSLAASPSASLAVDERLVDLALAAYGTAEACGGGGNPDLYFSRAQVTGGCVAGR